MGTNDRTRLLMIIAFCAAGMILFSWWNSKNQASQQKAAEQVQQEKARAPEAPPQPPPAATDIKNTEAAPVVREISTGPLQVRLTSLGASIEQLSLSDFRYRKNEAAPLILLDQYAGGRDLGARRSMVIRDFRGGIDFEGWDFRLDAEDKDFVESQEAGRLKRGLVFRARRGDIEIVKTYTFWKPKGDKPAEAIYDIGLQVQVWNRGKTRETFDYRLLGAAGIVSDEPFSISYRFPTARLAARNSLESDIELLTIDAPEAPELKRDKPDKLALSKSRVEWAALRARFFAATIMPEDPDSSIAAYAEPLNPLEPAKERANLAVGLKSKSFTLEPGEYDQRSYRLRAGPQVAEQLEAYTANTPKGEPVSRGLLSTITFSWWKIFERPCRWMLSLLEWSKNVIGSYGWGIVLMTLIVKLALHPLQRKGMILTTRSQEKMQALAPKMKELQEQYKDDPAKLQQATMRLYKEEGVNPAGMILGCLPMLLQMPVWIALYGSIMGAFGLRQAEFLWIKDLASPDTVLSFGFWPNHINLLPILYAGLMVAQSFMTPLPVDPQQRSQAWMMRFMPLLFFFFFYSMASAFVLYFVTNGLIGILETWLIKKQIARMKVKEAALAAATAGAASDGAKAAPITDANAFWAREAEKKTGKGKK